MADQDWWLNNRSNMRGYQNINKTGTQAWPEYDENYGRSFAGSVGHFDPRNLMRPDNLSQDLGASTYQAPPPPELNTLDPNWQHQLRMQKLPPRGNIDNTWRNTIGEGITSLKDKFSKFTTPMMQILKSQKNTPEEDFGMDYYGGSLRDGRVNRNPAFNLHGNMNVASGFGAGLGAAGDKRMDRIQETITNLPKQWSNLYSSDDPEDKATYAAKLKAHEEKLRQFKIQNKKYNTAFTGQGPKEEVITDKITETVNGPNVHGGEGNQGGSYQDQGGGYSTQGGFTQATQASPDTGRGHHSWADGGRIGYQGGELVDEDINIQGPGFDVNENMEMAETSPFEMRIQELVDEGLSWQEAYQIAAQEFGMAEGQQDSFSEEGIASLV